MNFVTRERLEFLTFMPTLCDGPVCHRNAFPTQEFKTLVRFFPYCKSLFPQIFLTFLEIPFQYLAGSLPRFVSQIGGLP